MMDAEKSLQSTEERPILIVGAGIFGSTAALELRRRGYTVTLLDHQVTNGPASFASSTDISKVIRSDYGDDPVYSELHTESIRRWHQWNQKWGEELYHETGLVVLLKEHMAKGTYPQQSYDTLKVQSILFRSVSQLSYSLLPCHFMLLTDTQQMGYPVQKLTPQVPSMLSSVQILRERYPQWREGVYCDAYFNPIAGWAESGRVVAKILQEAKSVGVELIDGSCSELLRLKSDSKTVVVGVKLADGREIRARKTIVAAGAWTPFLIPELRDKMTPVAQPVFHFQVLLPPLLMTAIQPQPITKLQEYSAPAFPVYFADPLRSGFYGFPSHPSEKCLKVAFHSKGYPLDPSKAPTAEQLKGVGQQMYQKEEQRFRTFLSEYTFLLAIMTVRRSLPGLKDAAVVGFRVCLYCDTFDGHFFIDYHPEEDGLFVAAGGSGHGFKFAPVLGDLIADAVERKPNKYQERFAWRHRDKHLYDVARYVPKSAL